MRLWGIKTAQDWGKECFTKLFGIGLTDNRSEFKMVDMFEKSTTN